MSEREELIRYLEQTAPIEKGIVGRLVDDVLAFYAETVEQFVVRRHREMMADGLKNAEIYDRLAEEVQRRRFQSNPLSVRQIRRLIYG
jgi:hypothetical protein